MARGLYYYKLVSPYPEDVTKNCKLTINEIDSNFLTLKDYDIKTAEFVRDEKMLVITRNNDEKIIVVLNDATYNLDVNKTEGESGATLSIKYDGKDGEKEVLLENVLTIDNLKKVIGTDILTKVITNNTLSGNGTMDSPLKLAGVEKTGSYAPAIGVIDTTKGEELPDVARLGTRYITKEYVNDYGFLYNGYGVEQITNKLDIDGRGWRVPTKEDWDALLNSIEPCKYRNHSSSRCHVELGKLAGRNLKSECGWVGQPSCDCTRTKPFTSCTTDDSDYTDDNGVAAPSENPSQQPCGPGVDKFGMTILPAGIARPNSFGRPITEGYTEKSSFWTTTHVHDSLDQDVYVKEFDWNRCGVYQIADCPGTYYSVRLVKDFDGSNYRGIVDFDGITYDTVLFPESGQIWLASNYASKTDIDIDNITEVNDGQVLEKRTEFYINEWNGKYWERKRLNEADTIVIENPIYPTSSGKTIEVCWEDREGVQHCFEVDIPYVSQSNIEYRVYTEDDSCNKVLVNTDDLVVERVLNVVLPMLDEERWEREQADKALDEKIEAETARATSAETALDEKIDSEIERALSAETELWNAIVEEVSARTEADEILDSKIEAEIERAISAEEVLNKKIETETERAISAETILDEKIEAETARATSAETVLDEKIDSETARATSAETVLNEKIETETERAISAETVLDEKIDAETERAKSEEDRIEGEIIDNPNDPLNEETAQYTEEIDGVNYYILKVNGGLVLKSKSGTNDIPLKLDADFGSF